jgi:hypothetical protein
VSKPFTLALSPVEIPNAERKLVAWWKLDETEGTEAADGSGNDHFGMLVGGPKWLPTGGKTDGALQFDGIDDYVQTSYTDDLSVWTVSAWINSAACPTSGGPNAVVHREGNYQINWDHPNDPFRCAAGVRIGGTWYGAGFGDLQPDTWYHLVATYDGESLKAYTNGVLVTETSGLSGSPDSEQASLILGRHAYDRDPVNHFAGTIDDVRIYNYPLAKTEVAALYSGKAPLPVPQTDVLASGELDPGKSSNWVPVSIVMAITIAITAMVARKKKTVA